MRDLVDQQSCIPALFDQSQQHDNPSVDQNYSIRTYDLFRSAIPQGQACGLHRIARDKDHTRITANRDAAGLQAAGDLSVANLSRKFGSDASIR